MRGYMGSKITVHKAEPGESNVGCNPRGVQLFSKENMNVEGDQKLAYISDLSQGHGFRVTEGDRLPETPLRYLCVGRADGTVNREEVLEVLKDDEEIYLGNVDRPEGNQASAV